MYLDFGGVCFWNFCPLWFWNRTGLKKKESRQRQKSSHEPYVFMKVCILGMYFFRNTLTVMLHKIKHKTLNFALMTTLITHFFYDMLHKHKNLIRGGPHGSNF